MEKWLCYPDNFRTYLLVPIYLTLHSHFNTWTNDDVHFYFTVRKTILIISKSCLSQARHGIRALLFCEKCLFANMQEHPTTFKKNPELSIVF